MQVVYFLSGLTCTDENFTQKSGAQRKAAELGLALVAPDTSPRGLGIEGEDERCGPSLRLCSRSLSFVAPMHWHGWHLH